MSTAEMEDDYSVDFSKSSDNTGDTIVKVRKNSSSGTEVSQFRVRFHDISDALRAQSNESLDPEVYKALPKRKRVINRGVLIKPQI